MARDADKIHHLLEKIKQEIKHEEYDEIIHSEDLKEFTKDGRCSQAPTGVNLTSGMEAVQQSGLCEAREIKYKKDEIIPYPQWYLTDFDIKREEIEPSGDIQHSQLVRCGFSEKYSENFGNVDKNTKDTTGDSFTLSKCTECTLNNNQNNLFLDEFRESVNVIGAKGIKSESSENMPLRSGECDNLSENELCMANKDADSEILSCGEEHGHKDAVEKYPENDLCGSQSKIVIVNFHSVVNENYLNFQKVTNSEEKPYKCDVCSKGFIHNNHLNAHKNIHKGNMPFKCDICNKRFTCMSKLKEHKNTHTRDNIYKCDICDKELLSARSLKRHRGILHTGKKQYKCDVCGEVFYDKIYLKKHKMHHTEDRPYKCDVCGKEFARPDSLKKHYRTHTGEKPYKCEVCEKEFARSQNLKIHKRHHTGEKPYHCDVCGKSFSTAYNLRKHHRTHTGERPYKCDLCGKGFSQNSHLKKHKKQHTDVIILKS